MVSFLQARDVLGVTRWAVTASPKVHAAVADLHVDPETDTPGTVCLARAGFRD